MNKEEILQKSIEKAVKNGWDVSMYDYALKKFDTGWKLYDWAWLKEIIFSHSFAKAFWGEENFQMKKMEPHSTDYVNEKDKIVGSAYHALLSWEYHLQIMVLEENPLEYLAKFLKGKQ